MKLLFDENLSPKLVALLNDIFPHSAHVRDVGLAEAQDQDVWQYAVELGFAIVSKDSDFRQRSLLEGAPPKVIWIRLGNCSTTDVERELRSQHARIGDFGESQEEVFLVLGLPL